jgi:hypothetical protein
MEETPCWALAVERGKLRRPTRRASVLKRILPP